MSTQPLPVYIVDDDTEARESMSALLDRYGYATRSFPDARQSLDALEDLPFGCVILDVNMPDLSGIELQEELHRRGRREPIVFVTGQPAIWLAVKAVKGGASDFLPKPVPPSRLINAVQEALKFVRE